MDLTAEDAEEKREVPPVSGGPPALVWKKRSSPSVPDLPTTPQASHLILLLSPRGTFYSSNGMNRKHRLTQVNQTATQDEYESEEEKMPEPWNVICIVGVRVYSRDETLELRTVMEAGELLEGSHGPKGSW
ncbi:hypothetical protein FOYG_17499 [Fusarium oxysporum NRRL 32931]|uniref:Uncharacterized protein n=1 Tax=Fusarium oxysporum NRRL 32931 TaxID=660029 RepID=W9HEA1_FUSOX|nr:hypothetical protein FOYG_17499 [Fusarium oxysporum NRRL 32931]